MPPDKIKLSPESARTFLEIGLKHVTDEQELASERRQKSLLYSFAKKLCVKKSYLYCSYPIDSGFYRLNLGFVEVSDIIYVYLASKDDNFYGKNIVSLPYDSAHKLIKLLIPSYVGAYFLDNIAAANFEQYLDILKLTKGKIGLNLYWTSEKHFRQKLLKIFTDRIYVLNCKMDQFEVVESLKFPVFDHLSVCSISNSDEILRVLKYKAKDLRLHCVDRNLAFGDNNLVHLKNEAVEKLHLDFEREDFSQVEELVKKLHKCLPSLKHFYLKSGFHDDQEEISVSQVPDRVFAYVRRMNDLKAPFENNLVNTHIVFYVSIYLNSRRNNSLIKAIFDKSEFKNWKLESHAEYFDNDGLDENGFAFRDKLGIKHDDARCEFKMFVNVFSRDVEDGNPIFEDEDDDSEDQTSEDDDE